MQMCIANYSQQLKAGNDTNIEVDKHNGRALQWNTGQQFKKGKTTVVAICNIMDELLKYYIG